MGDSLKRSVWHVTETLGLWSLAVCAVFSLNWCHSVCSLLSSSFVCYSAGTPLQQKPLFGCGLRVITGEELVALIYSYRFMPLFPTASHLVLCRSALLVSPEELVASRCTELERKATRWLPLHFSVNVHCNSRLIVFFKNRCEKVESKHIWTSASIYKINAPFIYLVGWMKVKSDESRNSQISGQAAGWRLIEPQNVGSNIK